MGDEQKTEAVVLFENEGEFRTKRIVRIGDDLFFVDANGGSRGAWESGSPSGDNRAELIDRSEARRLALSWAEEPERVAELLP